MSRPHRRFPSDRAIVFAHETQQGAVDYALMRTGKSGDFAAEIASGALNAFAQRKALEPGDLHRSAYLRFGILERLRHALLALLIENERLIEQADLLVESLQPGFDDLFDHGRRLALRLELIGKHVLLAL